MKTFKTNKESEVKKLAEKGIIANKVEGDISIYEVEEDVNIEGILAPIPEPKKKKDSSKGKGKGKDKK